MLNSLLCGRDRQSLTAILVLVSTIVCALVCLASDFNKRGIDWRLAERRALSVSVEEDFEIPPEDVNSPTEPVPPGPLPPYSLVNVLQTVHHFRSTFAVLLYDPTSDKFIAHYSDNMPWRSSCLKLVKGIEATSHALRLLFPDRFNPDNEVDEFAVSISSSDFPGIHWNTCLWAQRTDCIQEELGPILTFGSAFRMPLIPSMIAMPIPQNNHLTCYDTWLTHHIICKQYLPRNSGNSVGLVFEETIGLGWDDLTPQIVWRGTDFSYLSQMVTTLRTPNFDVDVASRVGMLGNVKTAATNAMRQVYGELIPRWKGVVWTAEAEREAEMTNSLPWCNIKFVGAMHMGKKVLTSEIESYQQFEEYGIPAIGEGMSLEELGHFKYHIDLGGGGGTTWSGTLEKLGLPGLLFHHVTPTKDYFHDKLEPWVHYVPVRENLSDLKQKYEWAESHPNLAKRISDNATNFARSLGTHEGMEAMVRQFYEWPLRQVVEAYQPSERRGDWREAMKEMGLSPITQCGGYYHHDCERLTNDIKFSRVHDRDANMSS